MFVIRLFRSSIHAKEEAELNGENLIYKSGRREHQAQKSTVVKPEIDYFNNLVLVYQMKTQYLNVYPLANPNINLPLVGTGGGEILHNDALTSHKTLCRRCCS